MKQKISFVSLFSVIILISIYLILENQNTQSSNPELYNKSISQNNSESSTQTNPSKDKKNPAFVDIDIQTRENLWNHYYNTPKNLELDNAGDPWISLGPNGVWNRFNNQIPAKFSGKVMQVELGQQGNIRVASVSGGLWERFAIGDPFPISDNIPSLKIGSFATHPFDNQTIYVGTGEVWTNPSNSGMGIYKTTDGGDTWNRLLDASAVNLFAVSKVIIHPNNPDTIYISGQGVNNNFLMSTNGGNSFTRNSIGFTNRISDMVIDPQDPTNLYVSLWNNSTQENIFKSTNSGISFSRLTGSGLPVSNVGNTMLTICNSQPQFLYAIMSRIDNENLHGIYRTTNGGQNWTRTNDPPVELLGGQGFHANAITVSPLNPNLILAGGVALARSTNGGTNWTDIASNANPNPNMHADIQSFTWRNNGSQLFVSNDGGIAVSNDTGKTFNTDINTFPISEVVYFDYSENNHQFLLAGLEHNGICVTANSGVTWNMTYSGDGSGAAIHPTNPQNMYMTVGVFPGSIYAFQPFFSQNSGMNWGSILSNITGGCGQWYNQIRSNRNGNDFQIFTNICKNVFRSFNNGTNWQNLNMPQTTQGFIDNGFDVLPGTGQVVVTTTDSTTANTSKVLLWLANSWFDISPNIGFKVMQKVKPAFIITGITRGSGVPSNKVYKMNFNQFFAPNWTNITGTGLSDFPLTDIQMDFEDTNRIIVGTQGWGCFITTNGGNNWFPWNEGLPAGTVVTEMRIIDSTQGEDQIIISTHGRGIFKRRLSSNVISVNNQSTQIENYKLNQNFPNPFNPITSISFKIPKKEHVTLSIFDINGREITKAVNGELTTGNHIIHFDGKNLSSGIYFYNLSTQSFTQTKKMILMK
ncbi:MAG: T9SS type A sorting domain-containing protein [Ignavibacteria bacterium]|nr:T9SS type A sorting domain-containing protein [Ignavibacteria bacterium]